MTSTDPSSPILTAITRSVGSSKPEKKRRVKPNSVNDDNDVVLGSHEAFDQLRQFEDGRPRKTTTTTAGRKRSPALTEVPVSRPSSPTPPYASPKKKSKTSKVSNRATMMQAAGLAAYNAELELELFNFKPLDPLDDVTPRAFWSNSTDHTCPDYELKKEGKLDGFFRITAEEWLKLPEGSHTKYTKKVWQGDTRKAVYAVLGAVNGQNSRQCSGYKSLIDPWTVKTYPDVIFYKTDGAKRTRSDNERWVTSNASVGAFFRNA